MIGPVFAPQALQHIKQHLTLHYLQSMRSYVAQAEGGRDTLNLHQEKPLDLESQQALAIASQLVDKDSQQILGPYVEQIQALAQKVQQAQQAQQQQAANADPTAQVILKTQMAETQRKAQESQARMQLEMQQDQQNYQLKIAELQQKVNELQAKYSTQTTVDSNRNATQIAMADINNASRERVATINANASLTADQLAMAHEQNQTAMAASNAAQQEIRQHGIEIEQQAFQAQAQQVQQEIAAQRAAQQAEQQATIQAQQTGLEHQAALEQAAQQQAVTPPTTPPTGAI